MMSRIRLVATAAAVLIGLFVVVTWVRVNSSKSHRTPTVRSEAGLCSVLGQNQVPGGLAEILRNSQHDSAALTAAGGQIYAADKLAPPDIEPARDDMVHRVILSDNSFLPKVRPDEGNDPALIADANAVTLYLAAHHCHPASQT